jgi:hypothetical protein
MSTFLKKLHLIPLLSVACCQTESHRPVAPATACAVAEILVVGSSKFYRHQSYMINNNKMGSQCASMCDFSDAAGKSGANSFMILGCLLCIAESVSPTKAVKQ